MGNFLFYGHNQNGAVVDVINIIQSPNPSISFFIRTFSGGITVDWGDGNSDYYMDGSFAYSISHNYSIQEIHNITITFDFNFKFLECVSQNVDSIQFDNCNLMQGLYIYKNNLNSLDLTGKSEIALLRAGYQNITTLDLSDLTKLSYLRLLDNNLTSLDLSNNINLTTLLMYSSILGNIDISNNTLLTELNYYESNVTAIDISNNPLLSNVELYGNSLPTSQVNNILTLLDSFGISNGTVKLEDQTPSAPPTGVGITAASNLVTKGWTVTTD